MGVSNVYYYSRSTTIEPIMIKPSRCFAYCTTTATAARQQRSEGGGRVLAHPRRRSLASRDADATAC